MSCRPAVVSVAFVVAVAVAAAPAARGQEADPAPPRLHHVHLNSVDPDAAIAWYATVWPEGRKGQMAGYPAFLADMALLFNEVAEAPAGAWDAALQRAAPQSPLWHIGAFVNTTGWFERLAARGIEVLPLFTGPDDRTGVARSGLTPYVGIRTADRMDAVDPAEPREGGFGYVVGPDGALVEFTGGPSTSPSFSHVHLFHEQPRCAANWYVEHLGMTFPPRRDPGSGAVVPGVAWADCATDERGDPGWPSLEHVGTIRAPSAGARHAGGTIGFYPRQCIDDRCGGGRPLAPSRGQVLDHVAFAVDDLDARLAHLRAAGVTVLEGPYPFGAGQGVLIEGPDGLAIELVEPGR